jgi:hypothetical protein
MIVELEFYVRTKLKFDGLVLKEDKNKTKQANE